MSRIERIGDCTLYLGDCREILPTLGKVDAVVTDPPYGIGHRRGRAGNREEGRASGSVCSLGTSGIAGDDEPFDPTPFLRWPCVLWGANHYAQRLPHGRWLLWDKTLGAGSGDFSEFEVAWCSQRGADRIKRHMWMGIQRDSEYADRRRLHPMQKPIEVMRWCVEQFPDAGTILDPFMGSAPTGVACVKLGRKFIGVEIEPRYFDIACKRIEAAYAQSDMFVKATKQSAEQLGLAV